MPQGGYGTSIYFCILCKNCDKRKPYNSISLIFGTNEEHVMVDSRTKFPVNMWNIQGLRAFIHIKKDQTSVMATG